MIKGANGTTYAESRLHQELGELFVTSTRLRYRTSQQLAGRPVAAKRQGRASHQLLRTAIANIESTRSLLESENLRSSFFDDKRKTYTGMILAHIAAKNLADAFDYNERARSRALLDLLGSKVRFSRGALLAEETALRETIFSARAKSFLEEDAEEDETTDSEQLQENVAAAQKAYDDFLARVRKENKEQAL